MKLEEEKRQMSPQEFVERGFFEELVAEEAKVMSPSASIAQMEVDESSSGS